MLKENAPTKWWSYKKLSAALKILSSILIWIQLSKTSSSQENAQFAYHLVKRDS